MPENAQTLLKSILATLALIPGVLTLFGVISLPPSDKEVLRIAVVSASIVSAVIVFVSAPVIARARTRTVVFAVTCTFLVGVVSLFAGNHYYSTLNHEYTVDGVERIVTLPITAGPLQRRYADVLEQALESSVVGAPLRNEIDSRNNMTPILWSGLLVIAQIALTFSILLGVVRLTGTAKRGAAPSN